MTKDELDEILFFMNDAQTTIERGEDLNYTLGAIEKMRANVWTLYHALEAEPLAVGWLHELLYVGGELVGARFRSEGAHQMYKTIEPDSVPVTIHARKP